MELLIIKETTYLRSIIQFELKELIYSVGQSNLENNNIYTNKTKRHLLLFRASSIKESIKEALKKPLKKLNAISNTFLPRI